MAEISARDLAAEGRAQGLLLPSLVYDEVAAAIRSDQHIVLTGAPGTGKTTLAAVAAEVGRRNLLCTGVRLATASADWTTDDTVGSYRTTDEGAVFVSGLVL